jgi:hypothetical protein
LTSERLAYKFTVIWSLPEIVAKYGFYWYCIVDLLILQAWDVLSVSYHVRWKLGSAIMLVVTIIAPTISAVTITSEFRITSQKKIKKSGEKFPA